jgi:hypothetical protein
MPFSRKKWQLRHKIESPGVQFKSLSRHKEGDSAPITLLCISIMMSIIIKAARVT